MQLMTKTTFRKGFTGKTVWPYIQGWWLKLAVTTVFSSSSSNIENRWGGTIGAKSVMTANPNWKGAVLEFSWEDVFTAPNTWDWSVWDTIVADMAAMTPKRGFMFLIRNREFFFDTAGLRVILPSDMITSRGMYGVGTAQEHEAFNYVVGTEAGDQGQPSYILRYDDATLTARYYDLFARIKARYEHYPHFCGIGLLESSLGTIAAPYNTPIYNPSPSVNALLGGRTNWMLKLRELFPRSVVFHDGNQPTGGSYNYIADFNANYLQQNGFAISASNINGATNPNNTSPKGCLRYYADFLGKVPVIAQFQGKDYTEDWATGGAGGTPPTMDDLMTKLTVGYATSNSCIVQYTRLTTALGSSPMGFKDVDRFVKGLPRAGGLVATKPLRVI